MSERHEAERLDDALERLRAGASPGELDADLRPLLDLASRLDAELPDDLPDPAFTERLRHDLLGQAGAPETVVELEPRRRRSWYYDWRFGAAAAATAAVLIVALIAGTGLLGNSGPMTPAQETVVSALAPQEKTSPLQPLQQPKVESTRVVTNTTVFPPLDGDHVVRGPAGLGAGAAPPAGTPEATPSATPSATPAPGLNLATSLPELPQTARTWLLLGPASQTTFLQTLMARLGLTGEIEEQTEGNEQVAVVVDESGVPVIRWSQRDAYLTYTRAGKMPTPPPARATADAQTTARDWLTEIGFDLTTIKYTSEVREDPNIRVVTFTPSEMPADNIQPGISMTVGVSPDGAVQFAYGFWLTLKESVEVPLRTSQDTWDAARQGQWYSPSAVGTPPSVTVTSATLSYLLTRAEDSSYLLQPVMAFSGEGISRFGSMNETLYVSAVRK